MGCDREDAWHLKPLLKGNVLLEWKVNVYCYVVHGVGLILYTNTIHASS